MRHDEILNSALEYAKKCFAQDATGHDYAHTLRVYKNALHLQKKEGGDAFCVALAAILHDVDDHKLFSTSASLEHARDFMRGAKLDEDIQAAVCRIISAVSFTANGARPLDTIEEKIVQDADRLDAMGAMGIARAFAYGGAKGRSMHTLDGEPSSGTTIDHFYEKLLLLKDMLHTQAAREIAAARHDFMLAFLHEFFDEWNADYSK